MVVKYWPAAAPREENASPFLVKQISRASVEDYLKRGQRYTIRGITLYTKPTDILEVGFLIRRKAGNAVERNKTRRLFRGLLLNSLLNLSSGRGYLFLFHRTFRSTPSSLGIINQLLARYE
ncbi:MAG: ribonuclease P protein component [FCB group bacterium]|nr:ribonuclease P protein component [FCB group bacterium]